MYGHSRCIPYPRFLAFCHVAPIGRQFTELGSTEPVTLSYKYDLAMSYLVQFPYADS